MSIQPLGFTSKSVEEELVNHYLKKQLYEYLPNKRNIQHGLAVPDHFIVLDTYVYDYDPQKLQELFREKSLAQLDNSVCYFFCPQHKKYRRGHGENKAATLGYWKSRSKKITRTSQITGKKIGLTLYWGQQQNSIVTEYEMHQHRLVSNNIYDNIAPKEIPYYLCYIKHDQGENEPIRKEDNSSTSIISTANDSKINTLIQSDHQGDQTMKLEETYSSQPPIYYGTNDIDPTQLYYDVDKESAFPFTNYAYAESTTPNFQMIV